MIRSKGVGIYFCSQSPDDIPDEVLGQLGNRVQHALRAYTPRDQKAVRTAAETFVPNPRLDVTEVISRLAVGEALVSTLQAGGVPMPVERTLICPPRCRMGPLTTAEREQVMGYSPVAGKYDAAVNRESAYEILNQRTQQREAVDAKETVDPETVREPVEEKGERGALGEFLWGNGRRQGVVQTLAKQAARTVGSQLGRQILRGLLGGILGGKSR